MGPRDAEGLVVAVRPRWVLVRADDESLPCDLPRGLQRGQRTARTSVAVGDRVHFERVTARRGRLLQVLPRRTKVSRLGSTRPPREHVIAANVDTLLALQSADQPAFNARVLDRLLVVGEVGGIACAIVLNKSDLIAPARAEAWLRPYRDVPYPCFVISALSGAGIDALDRYLEGRQTVMLGASGVGKSTLLNRLVPGARQKTAAISSATGRGVHTTTRVDFIDLPRGALLDTPGLRAIQPWGIGERDLGFQFPEFRSCLGRCHFKDCLHRSEPDCAVRAAVESGQIDAGRYESYARILATLATG